VLTVSAALSEEITPVLARPIASLKKDAPGHLQAYRDKLPRKQRTELGALQVETLLLLSRQLRFVAGEELWKASGSLVRSAMVMGLHVNLTTSAKLPPFQAECRRRLWITIVEFDLQMSISGSMPMMTPELNFEPLTPANLDDSAFDEDTTELPSGKPLEEETDSLYQICLAKSLSQRIRAMTIAQRTSSQGNVDERIKQKEVLEELFQQVPPVMKPSDSVTEANAGFVLNRVIVDVFLHRPLLSLLQPLLHRSHHPHPSFTDISKICLDISASIISYQNYFASQLNGIRILGYDAAWNTYHEIFSQDMIPAALGICEHLKLMAESPLQRPTTVHTTPRASGHSFSRAGLTELVEYTLDTLKHLIKRKGTNVKDIILLSVALESARTTEQKDMHMSQGAQRALAHCRDELLNWNEFRLPSTLNKVHSICYDLTEPSFAKI
jgi:hypothetical protein